jgi:hypothetical protein
MDCYCDNKDKPDSQVINCTNCNMEFHATCYEWNQDVTESFYCEQCILYMMEPLVVLSEELVRFAAEYNFSGVENFFIELREDQVKRLEKQEEFLTVFMRTPGVVFPPRETLQCYMNSTIFPVSEGCFNIIPWSAVPKQHRSKYKRSENENLKASIFFNYFEGQKEIVVALSKRLLLDQLFINTFEKNLTGDDELVAESFRKLKEKDSLSQIITVPMTCPLTLTLMKFPGKGVLCRHQKFFCLKSYIEFNYKLEDAGKKWRCPICFKRLFYSELFFDRTFQAVIKVNRCNCSLRRSE